MILFSLKKKTFSNKATLFEMANDWINTPFRFRGFTKNGCDCCGLIVGILYENKIIDKTFIEKYKNIKFGSNLLKLNYSTIIGGNIMEYFDKTENIKATDLILTNTKNSPIHFIIYEKGKELNEARIIHTTRNKGRVFISNAYF